MDKERDQRAYSLFQKYRFTVVLFVVTRTVNSLEEPYSLKPSVSGVHGYPPRAMAVIVFMMEEIHLTYRGATAYLYAHSQTLAKLGPDKVPSKSTIHRASKRISEPYCGKIHFSVIKGMVTGNMADDSGGFSMRKFIVWFSGPCPKSQLNYHS